MICFREADPFLAFLSHGVFPTIIAVTVIQIYILIFYEYTSIVISLIQKMNSGHMNPIINFLQA